MSFKADFEVDFQGECSSSHYLTEIPKTATSAWARVAVLGIEVDNEGLTRQATSRSDILSTLTHYTNLIFNWGDRLQIV